MPLDPSIIFLERIAQPPAIIEMVRAADLSSNFFAAIVPTLADEIEADVERRLSVLGENMAALWNNRHEGDDISYELLVDHLEGLIGKIVKNLARTLDQAEKRFDRERKKHPSLSKLKPYHDRIIAAGRREIEEKIDAGLIARAIRADRSKDSRGGQIFDNPTDLGRFLGRELA